MNFYEDYMKSIKKKIHISLKWCASSVDVLLDCSCFWGFFFFLEKKGLFRLKMFYRIKHVSFFSKESFDNPIM